MGTVCPQRLSFSLFGVLKSHFEHLDDFFQTPFVYNYLGAWSKKSGLFLWPWKYRLGLLLKVLTKIMDDDL